MENVWDQLDSLEVIGFYYNLYMKTDVWKVPFPQKLLQKNEEKQSVPVEPFWGRQEGIAKSGQIKIKSRALKGWKD